MKHIVLSSLSLMLLGACASAQLPPEQLSSSEAAIRSAGELGAEQVPQAALHKKLAEDQLAQAKKLAADGDEERANLVLARASADAELAVALVKEANAENAAAAAATDVRAIQGKN